MRKTPSPEENEQLERLLDETEAAFEEEDAERALELSERSLELEPKSVDALHYRASALVALDRVDEAHEAFGRALKAAPEDLPLLHAASEFLTLELADRDAYEDALDLLERGIRLARRAGEDRQLADFLLLKGVACNGLGECERALGAVEEGLKVAPDDAGLALEKGFALFELCRFGEARAQLERVLDRDRGQAWAHHYLGLIDEREGDSRSAERHFSKARKLAPDELAAPIALAPKEFDKAVEDALLRLPEKVRGYLSNVTISVEDVPRTDELIAESPPLSPLSLGMFRGTPVTEQTTSDPWSHFPSAIVLYQKNLERFAQSRDELIEEIGVTLVHEVGHFLGLSEEDLYERGLD